MESVPQTLWSVSLMFWGDEPKNVSSMFLPEETINIVREEVLGQIQDGLIRGCSCLHLGENYFHPDN